MNMIKCAIFLSLTLALNSCQTAQKQPQIIGGDKDKYGCKGSAGYQWSELRKECIRSFELPLLLYNQDKTFGAGVLFTSDSNKVEVFCKEGRFVLNKVNDTTFKDSRNEYSFEIKGNEFRFIDEKHVSLYQLGWD
jgi:hypothetical protein